MTDTPHKRAILQSRARYFIRAIREHGGVMKASEAIGVSRVTIYRVLRRYQEQGAIRKSFTP